MSARTPFAATVFVVGVACSLLIASCSAAPTEAPAPSSVSSISSSASAGPAVTVPGLSTAVPSPSVAPSPSVPQAPAPSEPAPTSTEEPAPPLDPTPQEPVQPEEPTSTPEPEPAPAPAPNPAPARNGKVVVIDPGHNGANGANPGIINTLVDAGFGETKPCNTTGTATNAGYTEHEFTWAVAREVRDILEANGVTVILTRESDDGVGPCVNKRAAVGNQADADLVLSIHGDGVNADSDRGFYVMTAQRQPAGPEMAAQSARLATTIRDGLVGAGLSPSNYLGDDGLWQRDDLAGLNLSERPTVMVESGNMRSSADAALMTSEQGQRQFAQGYANGVLNFLGGGAG
jgi:N-acetylmuramoyl-L-alanine amidase